MFFIFNRISKSVVEILYSLEDAREALQELGNLYQGINVETGEVL
jgi:hypothetical protein